MVEYLAFGASLQQRRLQYLNEAGGRKNALVVGDGDGRFLGALLTRHPHIQVDFVELSGGMLRLARRRAFRVERDASSRVRFRQADARSVALPEDAYCLIVTHFFLDCLSQEDCDAVVRKLATAAAPGALWIVSEFRQPASGVPKYWARFWIWLCYLFFRVATGLTTRQLPDYARAMHQNGFRLAKQRVSRTGLLVSQLWAHGGDYGSSL
jgi:ubiquinone/menaquinone biosynthesis C-methylase UbiE